MVQLHSQQHTRDDIIWSALAYKYSTQVFTDYPYAEKVRDKVDALFLQIWGWLKHVHTDTRRTIHEFNGDDFSVQRFDVHSSNILLGNHFHKKSMWHTESDGLDLWKLSELFIFDEGGWFLLLQNIDPEWQIFWKIEKFRILARDILVIPPFQAHTLFLESGTKFRWFRPYRFDETDMDMNPCILELPTK